MNTYRISEMAQKYTDHDMIGTYTALPSHPETRTRLLYWFLTGDKAEGQQELFALAVSLAQLGLDTHDLVEETGSGEQTGQARSRQMKVLAGDYFNGRFYQLLSHAERIDVVRLVSRAIGEVNRLKMSLYEKFRMLKLTAEEYLEQSVAIRSELFLSFGKLIPSRYADRFPELLRSLARCEVLSEEIDRGGTGEIRHGWAFWYMLQTVAPDDREKMLDSDKAGLKVLLHKYKIHGLLSQMLQLQIALVTRFAEQFDSEALMAEIGRMLEPFALRLSVPKVAEEI